MVKLRGDPKGVTEPALKKSVVISPQRGQLIAQSWPRKRGKATKPVTVQQIEWLTWSAKAYPYMASTELATAFEAAKGSGLYPRDLLTLAAAGKLYDVITPEGNVLTRTDDKMEFMVFNGAILKLAGDLTIGSGVELFPDWDLPVRDTFSFWNAGNPDRLTIPTGVTVVELFMGGRVTGAATSRFFCSIKDDAGNTIAADGSQSSSTQLGSCSTGPIIVRGGDYFRSGYFVDSSKLLNAANGTFFAINVLENVCPPG